MRVRVGAAHDGALVFKDLHPFPLVRELGHLVHPGGDHPFDGGQGQLGQGLAVIRREADDPAGAPGGFQLQQGIRRRVGGRGVLHQGGEVVGKDEGTLIVGVDIAGHPGVARTEEAVGIMGLARRQAHLLDLALPGALGPVRGDQHVLAGERVEAAVGVINGVEHHHSSV